MATRIYYAYNAPAGMTATDFATMIGNEIHSKTPITNVSVQDNEAMLTFEEPGYSSESEWFLQRVSIACYAKRCISHRKSVCLTVRQTVCHTLV